MSSITTLFLDAAVKQLEATYVPRIAQALDALPDADLFWRPHPGSTSVGNLLKHLEGNVRQWILCGLGGAPDHRERATEFAIHPAMDETEDRLYLKLKSTVSDACAVIRKLSKSALRATHEIQGFRTTGLEAVLHVVEHFGWHTGQIVWIAKQRAGAGHQLRLYDDAKLNTPPPV